MMECCDFSEEEVMSGAERLHRMMSINESNMKKCEDQLAEYKSLHLTLSELLKKARHNVLVPVGGGIGYFEGQLVHTNDVLVLLGDNWWANRSVFQATDIVTRRIQFLQREQKVLAEERHRLDTHQDVFSNSWGSAQQGSTASRVAGSAKEPSVVEASDEAEPVLDPEDELTADELAALEIELADKLDDDDYVEKVLLERMLEKRKRRLHPPPATYRDPSDVGRGFQPPEAPRVAAPSGLVGDVVERPVPAIAKEAKPKVRESLFRQSMS